METETFKIGTQVHLHIPDGNECAIGWITEWNDDRQVARGTGFRPNRGYPDDAENFGSFTQAFATGWDLSHDPTAQTPGDIRLVASFHLPGECPWAR